MEEYGIYATLSLVTMVFIMIGSLGFITELQRRLPVDLQHGSNQEAVILVFQVLFITISVFAVCALTAVFPVNILGLDNILLLLGIFGGLTQLVFSIVSSETRARQKLRAFASEILFKNLIVFIAGLLASLYYPDAAAIYFIESSLTLTFSLWLLRRFVPDIRATGVGNLFRKITERLINYRWLPVFSMLLIGFMVFTTQNLERYLAKTYLSIEAFAILSFGLIIPYTANMIQSILNSSIFTSQVLQYHEHRIKRKVVVYSLKISLLTGTLFLLLSIPAYFISKEIIIKYYPNYSLIVTQLHWLFIALVVRSSDFVSNIFTIINKPHITVVINVIYLTAILCLIGVSREYGWLDFQKPQVYFMLNLTNAVVPAFMILLAGLFIDRRHSSKNTAAIGT